MLKPYSRLSFIKFISKRSQKYKGTGTVKVASISYLDRKFITAATVNSVLGMLQGVNYALMGGFALGFHGFQRATMDIDIMVNEADIPKIVQMLGLQNPRPLTIGGMAATTPDGTEVDLVAPDWPWVPEALANAQTQPGGKVLSKPYMVIAKLWAARGANDDNDVYQLIKLMNAAEKNKTKQLVQKFLPNDMEDFDSMLDYSQYM